MAIVVDTDLTIQYVHRLHANRYQFIVVFVAVEFLNFSYPALHVMLRPFIIGRLGWGTTTSLRLILRAFKVAI